MRRMRDRYGRGGGETGMDGRKKREGEVGGKGERERKGVEEGKMMEEKG